MTSGPSTREKLRYFFEVDRHWITVAALKALADDGTVKMSLQGMGRRVQGRYAWSGERTLDLEYQAAPDVLDVSPSFAAAGANEGLYAKFFNSHFKTIDRAMKDAGISKEQLDVPQTQAEHVIQPDSVADDLSGKAMTIVRVG